MGDPNWARRIHPAPGPRRADIAPGSGDRGRGMRSLLEPGINCWRLERARRVALLVDAASYFGVLAAAMARAHRSIVMVGWDFHSQMCLRPRTDGGAGATLAEELNALAARNRRLHIDILGWDWCAWDPPT